jgi:hypothetical protein
VRHHRQTRVDAALCLRHVSYPAAAGAARKRSLSQTFRVG